MKIFYSRMMSRHKLFLKNILRNLKHFQYFFLNFSQMFRKI